MAGRTMAETAENRPKRPQSGGKQTTRQSRKRQPSRTYPLAPHAGPNTSLRDYAELGQRLGVRAFAAKYLRPRSPHPKRARIKKPRRGRDRQPRRKSGRKYATNHARNASPPIHRHRRRFHPIGANKAPI